LGWVVKGFLQQKACNVNWFMVDYLKRQF